MDSPAKLKYRLQSPSGAVFLSPAAPRAAVVMALVTVVFIGPLLTLWTHLVLLEVQKSNATNVWQFLTYFSLIGLAAGRSPGLSAIFLVATLATVIGAVYSMRWILAMSSISALVRSQTAELTRANEQLNALIDASPYAIVCIDAQRHVILWNASAERLFGYTDAQVIGQPYPLVLPEESEEFERRFKRLADGEVLRNMASHRRHRDGTVIDTSSSAAPFFDADGNLGGAIFAIEDARERNEVQNQLRQAQKMEAIGQLTGGLAHDFNNLLGVIIGNLDLLTARFDAGSEEWELADAAIQAAVRGAELIRRLLAFSRRQPLAPTLVHLPPLLESISELLRRTLGENIRLVHDFPAGVWPLLIDASQLESTILNLAVNARDAMPDGGHLTIEASNVVVDEHASELNLEATVGDYVVLAVSDTGAGMTPEVLSRAFEPFFTTKGNKGSGLGLSMVHGFVKQSGGYSKIYSEPGRGTTIRLYFPRAASNDAVEPVKVQIEALPRGQEVILVVEDNLAIRDVAIRQLQTLGYQTLAAASGDEALKIIGGNATIDLLFTDVVMPGELDGRALASEARRLRPTLKVLFTSGFTAAAAVVTGNTELGSNLLSKPYRKSELARRIRAALDAGA